jgi:hypothetical protein
MVRDKMIYYDHNMIVQRVSMQEKHPHLVYMSCRISENMIKITKSLFQAVHKFLFSEWNCGDLHYANKRMMPGDRNQFWRDAGSRAVVYWRFTEKRRARGWGDTISRRCETLIGRLHNLADVREIVSVDLLELVFHEWMSRLEWVEHEREYYISPH